MFGAFHHEKTEQHEKVMYNNAQQILHVVFEKIKTVPYDRLETHFLPGQTFDKDQNQLVRVFVKVKSAFFGGKY